MTGVTIRDNSVELINPPISTMASGEISGFVESAMGISPPMAVREVSTIGKKTNFSRFAYGGFQILTLTAQLVGKIHQQNRILYFDACQCNQSDDGNKG